jgi:hypothetical protein
MAVTGVVRCGARASPRRRDSPVLGASAGAEKRPSGVSKKAVRFVTGLDGLGHRTFV